MADTVTGAIEAAIGTGYFTKPIPASVGARARYLLKREGGSVARVARRVGVAQSTVRRWASSKDLKQAITPRTATRLQQEVESEWQPGLRRARVRQLVAGGGVTVETRATFGYMAPAGTTDDPRLRRIAQRLPGVGADLLKAYQAGASERDLANIVALGLQREYFQDRGARAEQLRTVELTDIDYMNLEF